MNLWCTPVKFSAYFHIFFHNIFHFFDKKMVAKPSESYSVNIELKVYTNRKQVWKVFYFQIKNRNKKCIYSTIYKPATKFIVMLYWTKFIMKIIFKQPRKIILCLTKKTNTKKWCFLNFGSDGKCSISEVVGTWIKVQKETKIQVCSQEESFSLARHRSFKEVST